MDSARRTAHGPGTAVTLIRARQFLEAVTAHDFETAERFLDPAVETVTPRTTFHGVAAGRQVLHKARGDEQFTMEQTSTELEEIDREIARWRETGEVAYEREVAVRLTFEGERITRVVVMPGGA